MNCLPESARRPIFVVSARWWFLAAVIALLAGLWGTRLIVRECTVRGCVLVNRWTGSVTYQRAIR